VIAALLLGGGVWLLNVLAIVAFVVWVQRTGR
jgi:hypothetical protein